MQKNVLQVATENARRVAINVVTTGDMMTGEITTDQETTEEIVRKDQKVIAQIGEIAMMINGNGNQQFLMLNLTM